ncbi:hypothetical protein [Neisseria dentiae]|uniref:hypothetical protein n=1 Tax=Neisseria dentiae TaxID=194197 RepID=UPI0035A1495B
MAGLVTKFFQTACRRRLKKAIITLKGSESKQYKEDARYAAAFSGGGKFLRNAQKPRMVCRAFLKTVPGGFWQTGTPTGILKIK